MKQRVITGLVFGIVFIGAVLLINTIAFAFFCAAISIIAVWEIEKTVGLKNKLIIAASLALSGAIPFIFHFAVDFPAAPFGCLYVVLIFIFMLIKFETTKFEQAVTAIFASLCVPYSFSLMIVFRDVNRYVEGFNKTEGIYLLLFCVLAAWMTDIFAYFVGSKLGKHKLCPKISPKKSVEGAIGGILGAVIVCEILLLVFNKYVFTEPAKLSYIAVLFVSMVLSVAGMFGDLAASTIKRNFGIKDFGNLLPGHGGIMDRFDSLLFIMPVLYGTIYLMNSVGAI